MRGLKRMSIRLTHRESPLRRLALRGVHPLTYLLPTSIGKPMRRGIRDRLAMPRADVVFVSFPKSGRTWVRVMVSRLYHTCLGMPGDDVIEFDNLHARDERVPRVLFTHDGEPWRRPEDLPADKGMYRGKRIVLLVRNPIDVSVSRYFHVRNRARALRHKEYASMPMGEFVWAPMGGIPTIVAFMNLWDAARASLPDLLVLRYEDLRSEPHTHLARLAEFLGLACTDDQVAEAVSFAAFENLRKLEEKGAIATARLGARQEGNPDSFKVRRGKVKGYRDYFTAAEAERMERYVRDRLAPGYGYPGGA